MLIYVKNKSSFFLLIDAFEIVACVRAHTTVLFSHLVPRYNGAH